jgi:processive 1,2-diacylglycerol beta-glucosyltransferase
MLEKNRVLILYSNYGEGHFQAARAIQEAAENEKGWQTFLLDMMEWSHPWFHTISQPLYLKGVHSFPRLYGHFYEKTKNLDTPYLLKQFLRTGLKRMKQLLDELEPSIVISTFPYAAAVMSLMKGFGLTAVPTATLITDHCDHRSWIHPHTDHYFVGSEDVYKHLSEEWVPKQQISITGIPVRSVFQGHYNSTLLKQKLGLSVSSPTLLVMGGGYGMIGEGIIRALETFEEKLQVVIICGKNEKRREVMQRIFDGSRHDVLVKGYVHNIHEWMAIADVLITKPGGSTISEALSMKLPMILYQPLPGQEQANAEFLCRHQVAVEAKDDQELKKWMQNIMSNPEIRTAIKKRMEGLDFSRSTNHILEQISLMA